MIDPSRVPKVSVCIITYNHERYIAQCLKSIMEQETAFAYEVIVGDDCSTDNTRNIILDFCCRYPEIIRPVFQPVNIGGGCNNYKVVHRMAKGEYIAHVDGDDFVEPGKLQEQTDFLDGNPLCSMVVHEAYKLQSNGRRIWANRRSRTSRSGMEALLKEQCYFTHSSKMYRSSIRDTSEVLNQDRFIDFELHIECAKHGEIGFINKPLVTYRETENSISKGGDERVYELILLTLRGYDRAIGLGVDTETALREKASYIYKCAVLFMQRNSVRFAEKCFEMYDEIPMHVRSKFYGLLLGGNFKLLRIKFCRAIGLLKSLRDHFVHAGG